MSSDFVKFPSTPHLVTLGGVSIRGDKVLNDVERREFLSHEVTIEEKIDGANLGISFDLHGNVRAQNRGSLLHLPSGGQWKPLQDWLNSKADALFDVLGNRYILFGEWCYATHSIFYDRLPDWFVGFDLFDAEVSRFASVATRQRLLSEMGIYSVPHIASGRFTLEQVTALLRQSEFGPEVAEGLYLRVDDGEWLFQRAKIVRAGFTQAIEEHWSRQPLRMNRLRGGESPA